MDDTCGGKDGMKWDFKQLRDSTTKKQNLKKISEKYQFIISLLGLINKI